MRDVDLAQLLAEASERLGVVGSQVATFHRGHLHQACFGTADQRTGVAVTPDTLFQVGSTTKIHTAALVMTFVDEDLVDLDRPIAHYVPGLRSHVAATTTLRHLLTMSAGLDNGPYLDLGWGDDAVAAYVATIAEMPAVFPPGGGFGYSNAATTVAGHVLEVVGGKPWDELLRERLLGPSGLASSVALPHELVFHPVALGHRVGSDGPELIPHWALGRALGPAGSTLAATAGDLVRLGAMIMREGRSVDGTRALSPAAARTMTTAQVMTPTRTLAEWWGVGPYGKSWDGRTVLGHGGTNLSGSSYLAWIPQEDIVIATVTNTPSLGYPLAFALQEEVFASLCGMGPRSKPESRDLPPNELERFTGVYESLGTRYSVELRDERLHVRLEVGGPATTGAETGHVDSELVPLGDSRFWPDEPALSGGRGWDLAFVSDDTTQLLVNGFFSSRKVA